MSGQKWSGANAIPMPTMIRNARVWPETRETGSGLLARPPGRTPSGFYERRSDKTNPKPDQRRYRVTGKQPDPKGQKDGEEDQHFPLRSRCVCFPCVSSASIRSKLFTGIINGYEGVCALHFPGGLRETAARRRPRFWKLVLPNWEYPCEEPKPREFRCSISMLAAAGCASRPSQTGRSRSTAHWRENIRSTTRSPLR